jgi:nucleotide-binding universal stress UspA family protein
MKTILIGYDESDESKRALERAVELAGALGSTLIVTSVAPVLTSGGRSMGAFDPVDTPAEHREELERARATVEAAGITADYVVAAGDPADAILEVAEERHADLIVVGTREPNFLQRMVGASVSTSVSRHAHCDVLIVH